MIENAIGNELWYNESLCVSRVICCALYCEAVKDVSAFSEMPNVVSKQWNRITQCRGKQHININ